MLYDKYSNELLMKIYEIEFWRLKKTVVKSSHGIGDLDVTNSFIVMFFVIEYLSLQSNSRSLIDWNCEYKSNDTLDLCDF